jgi:SNF2 family DNA or RNA helicase
VTRKRRIWLLSGTPVPNAPTDAWALTRLVNRDRVPTYFSQWRRQTMYQVSQYKWLPRMNSYELAYQAMQPAVRYRKKDCFDLPPMITTRRQAALTDEQKHAMTQLKYEAAAELRNGIQVTAVNAADKITKMRQVLLGVIKTGEDEYTEVNHAPRVALLMQEIAKAVSKVIIIVPFKGIIRALETQIAKQHTVEIINGDVPRAERTNIIKRFKDTNDPHVLLCHPKVMSHSLNLAEAATLIFYGPIYSNGMHQQVIERIARPDQIHDMTIARIGCHPLEWQIYADVDAQRDMQASILAMFKHYVLEEN